MAVSAFEMSAAGRNLDMILQTERLDLRCLTREDLPALRMILQDEETMYAYNGAFSEEETVAWLNRQTGRYQKDGFGLMSRRAYFPIPLFAEASAPGWAQSIGYPSGWVPDWVKSISSSPAAMA